MLKMLTAATGEIDDREKTVQDILAQLDLEHNLLPHSVGIIHCHSDFIASDVIPMLAANLPFPSVGGTSIGLAIPGQLGRLILTVTVLTSDDLDFAVGTTEPIGNTLNGEVRQLSTRLQTELPSPVALLIAFLPFISSLSGNAVLEELIAGCPDTPIFGSRSICDHLNYKGIVTFCNGVTAADSLALIAIGGPLKPQFLHTTIEKETVVIKKAMITRSNRHILQTINNLPALDYLTSLGLIDAKDARGIDSMPMDLTLPDGSHCTRVMVSISEKDIICGGDMPVGSDIRFTIMDSQEVIQTAIDMAKKANLIKINSPQPRSGGIILISCAVRDWSLDMENLREMQAVASELNVPYSFVYSSGEISPLPENPPPAHFLNVHLVACIL